MNYVVVMVTLIKKQTPFLGSENCVCGIEMHDGSCTPSRLTERRAKRKQDIGSASHSEAYYECNATITRPQAHRQTAPTEEKLKCEAINSAKPRANVFAGYFTKFKHSISQRFLAFCSGSFYLGFI